MANPQHVMSFSTWPKSKKKKKKKLPTLEQWAQNQAQKFIDAQIGAINQQKKLYLDDVKKQSELEGQRGLDLAKALQAMGFDKRIQDAFGSASSDVAGLAGGFSQGFRDQASAQATEINQQLAGSGQVARDEGVAMGDVTYGTGGFIPSRTLTESGAGFAAQAALQPSYAAQMGQLEASRVSREGMDDLDQFTQALIEARSQKPALAQDFLGRRKSELQAAREQRYEQLLEERDWYLKQAALANAMGDNARANQYLKLARDRERRMVNEDKGLDVNGNPLPGYKRGRNGQIVKIPKPKAAGSKGGGVNWGELQQDIASDLEDLYIEVDDPNPYATDGAKTKQKMPYKKAFNTLWHRYSGLVKNKARLRKMINRLLASEGITKPKPKAPLVPPHLAPGSHSGDR